MKYKQKKLSVILKVLIIQLKRNVFATVLRATRQSKLVGCYSRTVNPKSSTVFSWRGSLHEVLESFEIAETFDKSFHGNSFLIGSRSEVTALSPTNTDMLLLVRTENVEW